MSAESNEKLETSGYLANYAVLQETAKALREQKEADLDELIPMVDKALSAYKGCRDRIEAVRKMLDERLGGVEIDLEDEGGAPDA